METFQSEFAGIAGAFVVTVLGVVSIIAPWNFPIAIPAWKIAPALAYGNAVVFKPAELVPGSAWALAEILSRAGLPPGSAPPRLRRKRSCACSTPLAPASKNCCWISRITCATVTCRAGQPTVRKRALCARWRGRISLI